MKITVIEYVNDNDDWCYWGMSKKSPKQALLWYLEEHDLLDDYADSVKNTWGEDGWQVFGLARAWPDEVNE